MRISAQMVMPYERFWFQGKTYEVRTRPFVLGGWIWIKVWDIATPRGEFRELKFPQNAFVILTLETGNENVGNSGGDVSRISPGSSRNVDS